MLKKLVMGILVIASIGFSKTNQEIIDKGNEIQKAVFDKYFNSQVVPVNAKKNVTLMEGVYAEIVKIVHFLIMNLQNFLEIEDQILEQCIYIIATML